MTFVNIPTRFGIIQEADTMQVSRLMIWSLAVFAALCFALTPVMAGDHPWNEDENPDGGGVPNTGGSNPDDPNIINPDETDEFFGTSLWWLDLIWDEITDDDGATNTTDSPTPDTGTDVSMDSAGESTH